MLYRSTYSGPDILVCDEAHTLRSERGKQLLCIRQIATTGIDRKYKIVSSTFQFLMYSLYSTKSIYHKHKII